MSTAAVVQVAVLTLGVLILLAAASVPLIARRARRRATIERTRKDTMPRYAIRTPDGELVGEVSAELAAALMDTADEQGISSPDLLVTVDTEPASR